MIDRRERLARLERPELAPAPLERLRLALELRRRPEPAPDAAARPPLDQHRAAPQFFPLSARSSTASRAPLSRRCFAPGSAACRPSRAATHPSLIGHTVHAGRVRVQSVAPRSMMACVYAAARSPGVQASARAQSSFSTPAELGSPPIPNTRASTRLAFPSRIGCRSPRESARIAPAVERPIPGSAVTSSSFRGNVPPCRSTISPGAAAGDSAPARNTRARSKDAAPHRSAPPRGPRRSETAP